MTYIMNKEIKNKRIDFICEKLFKLCYQVIHHEDPNNEICDHCLADLLDSFSQTIAHLINCTSLNSDDKQKLLHTYFTLQEFYLDSDPEDYQNRLN